MIQLKAERSTLDRARADTVAMFLFEEASFFRKQIARVRSIAGGAIPRLTMRSFPASRDSPSSSTLLPIKGRALNSCWRRQTCHAFCGDRSGEPQPRQPKKRLTCAPLRSRSLSRMPRSFGEGPRFLDDPLWQNIGQALGEGAALALYKFDRYITTERKQTIRSVSLISPDRNRTEQMRKGLELAAGALRGHLPCARS